MRLMTTAALGFIALFGAAVAPAKAGQWSEAGGITSIPYGHLDYCKRNPRDCGSHRALAPMKLTPDRMKLLQSINASVNAAIKPVSDQDNYGKRDYWTIPRNGKGDCEDYVLMKRAKLMARGISPSQLLITMVQGSEAHIVLTARTDRGDYILDNMRSEVLPVEKTSYRYIKMQSPSHSGQWVSIAGRSVNVASN
ncbi:transglutaminase-like cysteine peptidase [Brucella pseudogrignonensis]|uniref:transglutaminase-like cysteine peptidase n=1 Tax=Brucella pseudogrignonensis TaxID=419475 RepID=UPI0028B7AF8C|nr:transglutaminase-like cysteine peptidase [Brucella pseudogrignonensis]MDT6939262.1 transglutaminase-like cysteine peptidase [Brucella pseudogrignonensis]